VKRPTPEQQKIIVEQWKRAGPELERFRREELRRWVYDWTSVDAVLDMGDRFGRSRFPRGMIEMQRLFMKAARRQGLLPPATVREKLAPYGAPELRTLGDAAILNRPKVALFCSAKCPGKLILDIYDLARQFREQGVTVISGFHSPMEQECLRILLRSPHPVVWCLARGMLKRIPLKPVDCRAAVADGRLLIVSSFKDTVRHVTAKTAVVRNRLVADMASVIVIGHAAPGSKIEALSLELLAAGKCLYTFDHPANAALIAASAHAITPGIAWKALHKGEGSGRSL
jgi:hypothetical protein